MKCDIRRLKSEEIEAFLWKNDKDYFEILSKRVDIEKFSRKLAKNSTCFTIYKDNTLVALATCYFNNLDTKEGYIATLTVLDGYRRKGKGSYLLFNIKEYMKRNGFKCVKVAIHKKNEISYNFYKKNGFNILQDSGDKRVMVWRKGFES